jgi:hypothetical protein
MTAAPENRVAYQRDDQCPGVFRGRRREGPTARLTASLKVVAGAPSGSAWVGSPTCCPGICWPTCHPPRRCAGWCAPSSTARRHLTIGTGVGPASSRWHRTSGGRSDSVPLFGVPRADRRLRRSWAAKRRFRLFEAVRTSLRTRKSEDGHGRKRIGGLPGGSVQPKGRGRRTRRSVAVSYTLGPRFESLPGARPPRRREAAGQQGSGGAG